MFSSYLILHCIYKLRDDDWLLNVVANQMNIQAENLNCVIWYKQTQWVYETINK